MAVLEFLEKKKKIDPLKIVAIQQMLKSYFEFSWSCKVKLIKIIYLVVNIFKRKRRSWIFVVVVVGYLQKVRVGVANI